jgi:hypothetical protein
MMSIPYPPGRDRSNTVPKVPERNNPRRSKWGIDATADDSATRTTIAWEHAR